MLFLIAILAAVPSVERPQASLDVVLIAANKPLSAEAVKKALTLGADVNVLARVTPRAELPALEQSAARGLEKADQKRVDAVKDGLRITITWPSKRLDRLHELEKTIADFAMINDALIIDQQLRRVFSPSQFRIQFVDEGWAGNVPLAHKQIVLAAVQSREGLAFIETHGLERFGLVEIVLDDLLIAHLKAGGALVNFTAQALVEGHRPGPSGLVLPPKKLGSGPLAEDARSIKGPLVIDFATPKSTDFGATTLEITFPKLDCSDHVRCVDEATNVLLGSVDAASDIDRDSKVVTDAIARANVKLDAFESKFRAGLPTGQGLRVKAPFKNDKGTELMWVVVQTWKDGVIVGRLDNDPTLITELKPGQQVTVQRKDVLDYQHFFSDGSFIGNEVSRARAPGEFEQLANGRWKSRGR